MFILALLMALLGMLSGASTAPPQPAALLNVVTDTTKPAIQAVTGVVSGQVSIQVTVTDDQPLDSAKNKQIWVEVYGRYNQADKKGQKVNLSSGSGVFTFDSTTLPDGEYILRVGSVTDAAGNKSGDKTFQYIVVDNTAPTATLSLTGGNVVNDVRYVRPGDTMKFTVVASDEGSGLDRAANIVFKLADNLATQQGVVCGGWNNGQFPGGSNTLAGSFTMTSCNGGTVPTDGPYGFAVRVYDSAGNFLRIPNSVYIVDGTKPVVSDFGAQGLVSGALNVSFKADDATSGVALTRVYLAEAQNGVCKNNYSALAGYEFELAPQANGEYAASIDTSTLNGEHCVLVSARDNAMNNSTPLFQKVTIDNTMPVMGMSSPSNGATINGVQRFVVTSNEDISKWLFTLNGKAYGPKLQRLEGNTWYVDIDTTTIADGVHTVTLRGTDLAGNTRYWNNRGDQHSFTIDNTAPALRIVDGEARTLLTQSGSIVVEATDPSGIREMQANVYRLDESGRPVGDPVIRTSFTYDRANVQNLILHEVQLAGLSDGKYELRYYGADTLRNRSANFRHYFTIDNTAPSDFAVISPSGGQTVNGTTTFQVRVSDPSDITKLLVNIGGKSLSWNNGASATITRDGDVFSFTLDTKTLADGETFIVLRATDGAGNTRYWNNNAAHRQHSFTIDNSGPVSDLNVVVQEDGTVIVSGTTNDPSAHNRAYVQLVHRETGARVGGTTIHMLGQGTSVAWSRAYLPGELANGTYAAHVALVDALGNVSNYGWTANFVVNVPEAAAMAVEPEPSDIEPPAPAEEEIVDETETEDAPVSTEETPITEEVTES